MREKCLKTLNFGYLVFALFMLTCGLRPLLSSHARPASRLTADVSENWAFERWWRQNPKRLTKLPLSAVEQRFARGFPGAIARFTDGKTVWVVRHLNETTRMLHPAADCFRGLGYTVAPPKVVERADNSRWRCFLAERGQPLQVCERIFDAENRQWTDVSAWYWENLLHSGEQAWWAVTEVTTTVSTKI